VVDKWIKQADEVKNKGKELISRFNKTVSKIETEKP
jgi:hypothetical protein